MESEPRENLENQPEEDRLSPELIERIEEFPSRDLPIYDKIDILLVRSGAKPSAVTNLGRGEIAEIGDLHGEFPSVPKEKIEKISNFLSELGLLYSIGSPENIENQELQENGSIIILRRQTIDIFMAMHQSDLDKLVTSIRSCDDEKTGEALGYPDTAIEAYVKKDSRYEDRAELPQEIKESPYYHFIRFALSPDHWQEEIKTAQKWADVVKTNSPRLFEEFIEASKKVRVK